MNKRKAGGHLIKGTSGQNQPKRACRDVRRRSRGSATLPAARAATFSMHATLDARIGEDADTFTSHLSPSRAGRGRDGTGRRIGVWAYRAGTRLPYADPPTRRPADTFISHPLTVSNLCRTFSVSTRFRPIENLRASSAQLSLADSRRSRSIHCSIAP
jgi:hypothetical protein